MVYSNIRIIFIDLERFIISNPPKDFITYPIWIYNNKTKWRSIIMNYKCQLQMLKMFLEDRIRNTNEAMIARRNKNLKYERRVYNEILVLLRDLKQTAEK